MYRIVNGTCDCADFPRAPSSWCKHRIAAGIQRRAMQAVQVAPTSSTAPCCPRPLRSTPCRKPRRVPTATSDRRPPGAGHLARHRRDPPARAPHGPAGTVSGRSQAATIPAPRPPEGWCQSTRCRCAATRRTGAAGRATPAGTGAGARANRKARGAKPLHPRATGMTPSPCPPAGALPAHRHALAAVSCIRVSHALHRASSTVLPTSGRCAIRSASWATPQPPTLRPWDGAVRGRRVSSISSWVKG